MIFLEVRSHNKCFHIEIPHLIFISILEPVSCTKYFIFLCLVALGVTPRNLAGHKYDHRVKNKKYTTPLPYSWDVGSRKTSWDGQAKKTPANLKHPNSFIFGLLKYIFYYKYEKCPYSIWCLDSNPWPLEPGSPALTTHKTKKRYSCFLHFQI